RAFAAASVHDFFNLIVLAILFPLEVATGFLTIISDGATELFQDVGGVKLANPIKFLTGPALDLLDVLTRGNAVALAIVGVLMTFAGLFLLVKILRSLMVARVENLFDRTVFRSPGVALLFGLVLTVVVQSSSITTSL